LRRENGIDILKSISAFLVVCIHAPFPGTAGAYFTALSRIAVPVFFMITGFFYTGTVEQGGRKSTKKIGKLIINANIFFLLVNLLKTVIGGESIPAYLKDTFTFRALLQFVLFNESPLASHLWYLGAVLYVLIIVMAADHFHKRKWLYRTIPFLLAMDLIFGKYSLLLLKREFSYIYVRNFLFVGIPYFCIGMIISQYREWIEHKLKKQWVYLGVLVFSGFTILERKLLVQAGMNATRDHYLSTTFLACAVFLLFLLSFQRDLSGGEKILSHIGRKCSTLIYILHPAIIMLCSAIFGSNSMYLTFRPIIIYACSVLAVGVYQYLVNVRKKGVDGHGVS
jgi:surface polysaccharide O-acyltransferase-like enzyme